MHALRLEPGIEATGRDQRVGRWKVGREAAEDGSVLADEGTGERAVAVERRVTASLFDDLEGQLVPVVSVGGELPGGLRGEGVQGRAERVEAHRAAVRRGHRVVLPSAAPVAPVVGLGVDVHDAGVTHTVPIF
jgi:hypothetical protein